MSYIANKQNTAQLTNIHYWDSAAGAWSGNLVGVATPFIFLPNPVALNDLVIFGIDSTVLDAGPFCSLVFDLLSAGTATITWKYSDASGVLPTGWAVQAMQDNTNQDGLGTGIAFDTLGIRSIHWAQDTLWVVQNPTIGGVALGVTGLWICADVTGGAGGAPPIQQNRDIYTITWPTADLAQPGGDMQTLLRIRAREESQSASSRFIAGLRKTDRGADFRSYINLADEQNAPGITVTVVGTGAFNTDVTTPVGRTVRTTNPAAMLPISYVALSSAYSNQWRGTFHLFLRAAQDIVPPPVGVVSFQVNQYVGTVATGRLVWSSSVVYLRTAKLIEVLDLGPIHIPGMKSLRPFSIYWEISAAGDGIADADTLDLILIPVDEWAVDTYVQSLLPGVRDVAGILGYTDDIDGITEPKNIPVAVTAPWATGVQVDEPRLIGGRGGLIPNVTQQLHTTVMAWNIANEYWWTQIFGVESMEVWQVQRYSSMRGSR